MFGVGSTVKLTPLLGTPLTVTTTLPVLAPLGTVATMDVALQLVAVALVPLNVTVLVPCVEPKFVPVIVTDVPTAPEVGDSPLMFGLGNTAKLTPLLFTPLAWTTTFPVVAPEGTGVTIELALQVVGVADVPLKLTVLAPCVEPKLLPPIVTEAPTAPVVGDTLLILRRRYYCERNSVTRDIVHRNDNVPCGRSTRNWSVNGSCAPTGRGWRGSSELECDRALCRPETAATYGDRCAHCS